MQREIKSVGIENTMSELEAGQTIWLDTDKTGISGIIKKVITPSSVEVQDTTTGETNTYDLNNYKYCEVS